MAEITYDEVLALVMRRKGIDPRVHWEADYPTICQLRVMRDSHGNIPYQIHSDGVETLCGIPVKEVERQGLRLVEMNT